jgi:O-antigen ligase
VRLRRKSTAIIVFVVALVPIFYSLNRGTWLALLAMAIYNALRVSGLRLSAVVPSLALIGIVVATVFSMGSTRAIVLDRFQHGQSNDIRYYTSQQSIKLTESSPIIGFGTDRTSLGGEKSIAIGRSAACPRCGNPVLGENGELWSLLVSDGLVGAFLYFAFLGYGIRRFWRDRTPVGIAGVGVLILAIGYSFIYNASGMPLVLYLISYALLWHNEQNRPVPV